MKRCAFVLLLFLKFLPAYGQEEPAPLNVYYGAIPEGEHTFFVATDGDDANAGTEDEPWATLDHAVAQVQRGDVIVVRGGVYYHDDTIRIQSTSGFTDELIVITAYPGEVPILDFSSQPKERNHHGVRLNANWWHLVGLTIRNASHNGIRMDGGFNILEQLTTYGNHDSGIHMAGGAFNNLIKNCDSFHNFNYDTARTPRVGNNADGFSAKFDIGADNRYYGVRSWENSDDGFDFWEAGSTIVIENSWSFGNGDASVFGNPDDFEGNGNGFKLGGNFVEADHVVIRSMAFDNFGASGNAKGFDYNNNRGAMTLIHNTAYNNGRNYYFPVDPSEGQAVFLNNLSAVTSLHAFTSPTAVLAGNSWQHDVEVTEDMFLSVDTELAKLPRQEDGSLPDIDLLKPVPESFLVDGGVAIGESFYGDAPDIGVYEYPIGEPVEPWIERGSGQFAGDLRVFDMEHAGQWSIGSDLTVGMEPFGDRDLTVSSISSELNVEEWIRTSAESGAKNYLFTMAEFTLTQPRQVFVAHSDDISDKPEWLADYVETSSSLTLSDSEGTERHMTIYQTTADAGAVVALGRNSTDSSLDAPMYLVLIGNRVDTSTEDVPVAGTELAEVYPNPFSGSATVAFSLARGSDVSIRVYDALGRELARLASGYHAPGTHAVSWNAPSLASGVYYVHMKADGFSAVKQLVRAR